LEVTAHPIAICLTRTTGAAPIDAGKSPAARVTIGVFTAFSLDAPLSTLDEAGDADTVAINADPVLSKRDTIFIRTTDARKTSRVAIDMSLGTDTRIVATDRVPLDRLALLIRATVTLDTNFVAIDKP
jgi:hypothetical protein